MDNCYVYRNVDQRVVEPGTSQRRLGGHSDSFLTEENSLDLHTKAILTDSVYLAYNSVPTEFCDGPFTFSANVDHNNDTEVLVHFEKMAVDKQTKTYPPLPYLK